MWRKAGRQVEHYASENKEGLSRKVVELMIKEFVRLNEIKPDYLERIFRYLLDDEDHDIVKALRLSGSPWGLVLLGLDHQETALYLDAIAGANREFLVRLGTLYECLFQGSWLFSGHNVSPWLQGLLERPTASFRIPDKYYFPVRVAIQLLELEGQSPELLVHDAFLAEPYVADRFLRLEGLAKLVDTYPKAVREALNHKDSRVREQALKNLGTIDANVEPFAEEIVSLAVSSAKGVRERARPLLKHLGKEAHSRLEMKLGSGKVDERLHAASILVKEAEYCNPEFWEKTLVEQKSDNVRAAIQEILRDLNNAAGQPDTELEIPPRPELNLDAGLDPGAFEIFRALMHEFNARAEAANKGPVPAGRGKAPVYSEETIAELFRQLEIFEPPSGPLRAAWGGLPSWYLYSGISSHLKDHLARFIDHEGVGLLHLTRWMFLCGLITYTPQYRRLVVNKEAREWLGLYSASRRIAPELRVLAQALQHLGIDADIVGGEYLHPSKCIEGMWEDCEIWPYFAERQHILEEVLGIRELSKAAPQDWEWLLKDLREAALRVIGMFPRVPKVFHSTLWDLALGSAKTNRAAAQTILTGIPGTAAKVTDALKSKKEVQREEAAKWIPRTHGEAGVPLLRDALKNEQSDKVRAAVMISLESLGIPISEIVDSHGLLKDAERGLKSGIPANLAWFLFELMPKVKWKDSGEAVPEKVLTWWAVQHVKLKDPEAGPLIRRYAEMLDESDRRALGEFILRSWIDRDTELEYSRQEAEKEADQRAKATGLLPGSDTYEWVYKETLNTLATKFKYSAIKEKGVLALVGAFGGPVTVQLAENYIRKWFGHRVHQAKALIAMLSWVDSLSATQLLLALATRFRTKGIQDEANKYVIAIADRKGWTTEELADRTIPVAGFGEGSEVELDYGSRIFTVSLDSKLNLVIRNAEGKAIQSLPAPGRKDDPELVNQAKKCLSSMKKELKTVLKLQKERLYEAMCTQRTWRFQDWDAFLNRHPIVGNYCRSIVWTAEREGDRSMTFRPLDDGTLTDFRDEEVVIGREDKISIAHARNTSTDECQQWANHFRDYEIVPVFDQFFRPVYEVPKERSGETSIGEFKGHVIEAFTLRTWATKQGYTRGEAQDGGWFFAYEKRFPGLGVKAVLEFTGNPLPEENRDVALLTLGFVRLDDNRRIYLGTSENLVKLSDVPPVLLSECYNDIRMIAAAGKGFDPEWQSKSGY